MCAVQATHTVLARSSIRTPSKRVCEVCGRTEEWNPTKESWVITTVDGQSVVGDPHCIHEWDINGSFSPYE